MNRLRISPLPTAQLREALRSDLDALPDAELLGRFTRYADHPAFEVLLRRHGPMVLGVCRRMLAADADDAFQATFLVLIRKARELRGERLGAWLYGVAYRVALKARTRALRIANFRREVTDMMPDPNVPSGAPDWLPILDAELAAIPAKYRDPIVLCELQGASRTEAARTLGVPEGTLSSRLARGREMLRRRLLKHGTLLPAGGLAALFSANGVGRATVAAALIARTSELAKVATGAAPAGAMPVGAAQLTDEVLKSMFLTKLRTTGAVLTALALAVVGLAAAALPAGTPAVPAVARGIPQGLGLTTEAPVAPPRPAPKDLAGTAPVDDVKAVQGLWSVVRFDTTKALHEEAQYYGFKERQQLFIAGDVWWEICTLPDNGNIRPCIATLSPGKAPKWLDMRPLSDTPGRPIGMSDKRLYLFEPAAQKDQLTVISNFARHRPAEFNPRDEDTKLLSLVYQRQKLGPAAGVPALLGSWEQPVTRFKRPGCAVPILGTGGKSMTARVEVYDSLIFIGNLPHFTTDGSDWLGGSYTLDTTRNPPGIDITLFDPLPGNVKHLYGSYEVTRAGLQLVLGLSGKRGARPMDFIPTTEDYEPEQLYFDLKRAALRIGEKPETAPAPKAKRTDKPADGRSGDEGGTN
ncbi:sigma-70 family RNA polymerase sigma factor [Frigoriglobus tundricola]|uniref:ECF RNA polymerase sigma factor SigE n=1 Tax=Frigoriglobus tundricola TaxID=2774151 RepID=A0A6M5YXT2_9BACT|nr:sigma-70 family RNA polymerase sigma factor [Frigoriglobus tundricola]QJW98206.1 hypothetical protein FTUN_5787 [Frigoriglobus tundricola]